MVGPLQVYVVSFMSGSMEVSRTGGERGKQMPETIELAFFLCLNMEPANDSS